jgi:hypothetical protein
MSTERNEELEALLPTMSLSEIAAYIRRDWKKPYFGAIPYLDALRGMNDIKDNFGADDGRSIVAYFLSNANTWRGPVARMVKAELNRRLKK